MNIKKLEERIAKSDKFRIDINSLVNRMLVSTVVMLLFMLGINKLEEWSVLKITLSVFWSVASILIVIYGIMVFRMGRERARFQKEIDDEVESRRYG